MTNEDKEMYISSSQEQGYKKNKNIKLNEEVTKSRLYNIINNKSHYNFHIFIFIVIFYVETNDCSNFIIVIHH